MPVRDPYPYRSDSIIEFVSPLDSTTDTPLDTTNTGSTCSFKVYDPTRDVNLIADALTGAAAVAVSNAGIFVIGQSVETTLDDGSILLSTVLSVDAVTGIVGLSNTLPSQASNGNRFRRVFDTGVPVIMTEYGTPKVGSREYGFRGLLPDTDEVLQDLGQIFDIEIAFIGSVTGGLNLLDVLCGVVRTRGECHIQT